MVMGSGERSAAWLQLVFGLYGSKKVGKGSALCTGPPGEVLSTKDGYKADKESMNIFSQLSSRSVPSLLGPSGHDECLTSLHVKNTGECFD